MTKKEQEKAQKGDKKKLRRFVWDVTVGAVAGIITYLISRLL